MYHIVPVEHEASKPTYVTGRLWEGSSDNRWIPITKGQLPAKRFHVVSSKWYWCLGVNPNKIITEWFVYFHELSLEHVFGCTRWQTGLLSMTSPRQTESIHTLHTWWRHHFDACVRYILRVTLTSFYFCFVLLLLSWHSPTDVYRLFTHIFGEYLNHRGLVDPHGAIDVGQHWFRRWLVRRWHQST